MTKQKELIQAITPPDDTWKSARLFITFIKKYREFQEAIGMKVKAKPEIGKSKGFKV